MSSHNNITLSTGWEFKSSNDTAWRSAQVPGDVHSDLLKHGVIPDPFVDLNELEVAWVADETWHYRTEFETPSDVVADGVFVDLVFEGLDTYATVTLNGSEILKADNMFIEHRVDIRGLLNAEGVANNLEVVFEPARLRGRELVEEHPEHDFIVHQTEVSRGPVRKAQYHWGWDWGPILLTCGVWRPVRLETYVVRIEDLRADYEVSEDLGFVAIQLSASIVGGYAGKTVQATMEFDGRLVYETEAICDGGHGQRVWTYKPPKFTIPVNLWYPLHHGPQNLYTLALAIASHASTSLTLGFRKTELITTPDAHGTSFVFAVNNTPIFLTGSNWIPASSFLSQLRDADYTRLVGLVAQGNQNCLRVWGGGIYEHPALYATCDRLGVLVWQDFMFACASYPVHPSFITSITREATQAIRRLRHHPSLLLWCGNNEDYQLIERYNLSTSTDPDTWLSSQFPARWIYESLLPSLIKAEASPGTIYHPSSPFGNGTSTTLAVDPTVGDIHQWNIWHGPMHKYQSYPTMGGRFVSEFGVQSYPHLSTIGKFITNPKERHHASKTMEFHNKAIGHSRRIMAYVAENFRVPGDLASFAHVTQIMQSDALAWAYRGWRKRWRDKECGGVLVWQMNDAWPGTSWAVVDYFGVKKAAWYAIRRLSAPVTVGVERRIGNWTERERDALWRRDTGHVDLRRQKVEHEVWVVNGLVGDTTGKVVVRVWGVDSGELKEKIEKEVVMEGNGVTDVIKASWDGREEVVVFVEVWVSDKRVGWDASWPEPIKYLDFEGRGVEVRLVEKGVVEVTAERPVKGFVFDEREGVSLSDNGFDVMPGVPVRVEMEGTEEVPGWRYIGM
ncbi:hypothetical protein OQA88_7515 [Cercophora sp. LCS_1]